MTQFFLKQKALLLLARQMDLWERNEDHGAARKDWGMHLSILQLCGPDGGGGHCPVAHPL